MSMILTPFQANCIPIHNGIGAGTGARLYAASWCAGSDNDSSGCEVGNESCPCGSLDGGLAKDHADAESHQSDNETVTLVGWAIGTVLGWAL